MDELARTALGMALVRARESARDDRLFDDPYAQRFLDAVPGAFPEQAEPGPLASLGALFAFHGVLRTRFFDDYLLAATAAGCAQVVLLAAGLDTRALRLPWPRRVRVFELDLPEVLALKASVLGALPGAVGVDLRGPWAGALLAAGLDPGAPTAWLAEGLLVYLSADDATRLLSGVGDLSAPGSQLALEAGGMADSPTMAKARDLPGMARYSALWKGGLGADALGWLGRHGWRALFHDRAEVAATYGRAVPPGSSGGFITATRES